MAAEVSRSEDPVCSPHHVAYCFQSLDDAFSKRPTKPTPKFDGSSHCPFFVTLKKWEESDDDYNLRGCIGSLSPQPVINLYDYARRSAFNDRRFDPLSAEEMPALKVGVSLLVNYEEAKTPVDWHVGRHGIILDFSSGGAKYSATYLPEVASEQGWDQEEALASLVRKAGYKGKIDASLRATMKVTRYQSSKHALTYDEWAEEHKS